MQLFPSRPLPAHVKNVRTRAQSLNDFAGKQQKQKVVQPTKQRHAVSTDNINNPTARSPPKGTITKGRPLDIIAEGVELASNNSSSNLGLPPVPSKPNRSHANTSATPDDYGKLTRYPAIDLSAVNKHSPDQELHHLQGSRPETSMSTCSEPSSTTPKPKTSFVKLLSSAFKGRSKTSRCNQEAADHKKCSTNSSNGTQTVP